MDFYKTLIQNQFYDHPYVEKMEHKNRRKFLLGESMGGAVVLMLHRKEPTYWDGAILVAPMCKVAFSNIF
jgi:alpha-beta hydrolase superfamily lysophospholipase